MLFRFQYSVKLWSWTATWVVKNVAPRRLIGAPVASRPMVPRPHASMPSCSLRSKIPLGNWRQNLDRMVAVESEWVGGTPSTVPLVGSLYQPCRVSQVRGATRALPVSQVTPPDGAGGGSPRKSENANGLNADVRLYASVSPMRDRFHPSWASKSRSCCAVSVRMEGAATRSPTRAVPVSARPGTGESPAASDT